MSRSIRAKGSAYTQRKERYQRFLNKVEREFNRFVRLKLTVLILCLGGSGYFLIQKNFPLGGGLSTLGIFLLIYLDIRHRKIISFRKYATILRDINEHALWRLDDRWRRFPDTGAEFQNDDHPSGALHPYSSDLDIFGKGSLFQWINVTRTYLGRQKLHLMLTVPPGPIPIIRERQAAIEELAKSLSWRQWLTAHGIAVADQMQNPDFLFQWSKDRNAFLLQKPVVLSLRALPVLTIGAIILYFSTKLIPFYFPLFMVLLQYGLLKIGSKKRTIRLAAAGGYEKNLRVYSRLLRQIEKKNNFQSAYLRRLRGKLFNRNQKSASRQLQKLARIVDLISNRHSAFYSAFNILTLWDYQCLIALEDWKKRSGESLPGWLETIAEFEALASLAIIRYDHPEWAIPDLIVGTPQVVAEKLGHPLLTDSVRVPNLLQIGQQPQGSEAQDRKTQVLLITGSNMSGKSTYLRTAGINLVLAFTGAPVCAESFRCTPVEIHTCMRVSDNLEKSISTFYAEILRIKAIVEAAAGSRPVFFLLDEIFKGTNSLDRHTGAKILIKRLIQKGAIGLVSTHDLELGELAGEEPAVKNYHFQEHYRDNRLYFDYHLRPGISTTRNALYLMKAAGIIEE